MEAFFQPLLQTLALPPYALPGVFVVAFLSATLLPLGSEPAVYGLVLLNPHLFWPTILAATAGNTLGGVLNWWIGLGAHAAVDRARQRPTEVRALRVVQRLGPRACFFAFLPLIGDPLCSVAGWLRLPLWPCVLWMAAGKFLRYLALTALLLWVVPESWVQHVLRMA